MSLTELKLRNLRCVAQAELNPDTGINLIVGDNGSGKTTLLESIYLLSRSRSFRSNNHKSLIRKGATAFTVFGRIVAQDQQPISIGIERSRDTLRFRLSNNPEARLTDLVRALPVQVISPGIHELLEHGATQRRKVMDWGVFHVEQSFFPAWQRYQRALRQRNAGLRAKAAESEVRSWDAELIQSAEHIDQLRSGHIEALRKHLGDRGLLADISEESLSYRRGWSQKQALQEALDEGFASDVNRGYTGAGPHRADLTLNWGQTRAADTASRGEQKMLLSLMLIEQARLVGGVTERMPVLLIDDLAAELGTVFREQLMHAVEDSGLQAFVTFLDRTQIPDRWQQGLMFHVKQGVVAPGAG